MNIQRLVSIGCVGFFMFLAVINGLMASDAPAADSNHPQPVRAPVPMQEPRTQTTPVAPGRTAPVLSQPLPQPVPMPAPPAIAATAVAPTHSASGPVSPVWLLLVVTVIGALIGLMVLGQSRRRENGRFSPFSTLAHGVQSCATPPYRPQYVSTVVYRIPQEAMINIVRHAQASQATIRLVCHDHHLVLTINDNGNGMPQVHQSGVGLQSMRERAAELNGRCVIESSPGGAQK